MGTPAWMKFLIIGQGILVLLIVAWFAANWYLNSASEEEGVEVPKEKKVKIELEEMGQIFEIKDFTVNTADPGGMRFVIVGFAIESTEADVIEEIGIRMPQIRDALIYYLHNYTAKELTSAEFQETSKTELMKLINARINSGLIDSIYYTQLMIQ